MVLIALHRVLPDLHPIIIQNVQRRYNSDYQTTICSDQIELIINAKVRFKLIPC